MTERSTTLDFWTICYKIILFLFVVIASYSSELTPSSSYMLIALLYVSLSFSVYIVKKEVWKSFFLALSIMLICVSAYFIHPLMILLIPPNIYELASFYIQKGEFVIISMLIPLLFLAQDMLILYGFISMLSFMYFSLLKTYKIKSELYKNDIENLRNKIEQLTRSLQEGNEWIKQFEYTYKLEERNRLSQEIHDKIGHAMTGALIQMEASKRLHETNPQQSAQLLQNAIQISKDGIETIRHVLKNVKPPTEQLGINRMKLLIDEFSSNHLIQTSLTYKGNIDIITPIQWKTIQKNMQESLTNVLKADFVMRSILCSISSW